MTNNDPYAGIIRHREQIPSQRLADMLRDYIRVYVFEESHREDVVWFINEAGLTIGDKILLHLLARKVLVDAGRLSAGEEAQPPKQLVTALSIKGGTLRPQLRLLLQSGLLEKINGYHYRVPTDRLYEVERFLNR